MAEQSAQEHPFTEEDLDLLVEALRLVPDLEFAVYATKMARSRLQFPITSHDQLRALFEGDALSYRGRRITLASVIRYLPKEIFPVESPADCLGKVLIGLCWGATCTIRKECDPCQPDLI